MAESARATITCEQVTALLIDYVAGDLDRLLNDSRNWRDRVLSTVNEAWRADSGSALDLTVDDAISMLAIYGTLAPAKVVMTVGWSQPIPAVLDQLVADASEPGRVKSGAPTRPKTRQAQSRRQR